MRSGIKSEWESQPQLTQAGRAVGDVRSGIKSEWESQLDEARAGVQPRRCAPASSRSGSLNPIALAISNPENVCAPASSRSGSLNALGAVGNGAVCGGALRHQVGVGVSTSGTTRQLPTPTGALRHQVGVGVSTSVMWSMWSSAGSCAPASSRSGSLNRRAWNRWEASLQCAPASSRSGSLNTPARVSRSTPFVCAPASSRSGSLNLSLAFRPQTSTVRSGIKSEWESQPENPRHDLLQLHVRSGIKSEWESQQVPPQGVPEGRPVCAPASSRSGSLNRRGAARRCADPPCALRHQVGVGVSTRRSPTGARTPSVRSGIKSEWESQPLTRRVPGAGGGVRSGIKSEWESQLQVGGGQDDLQGRALRHQVGVGVSTRSSPRWPTRPRRCAPASSRSGSLNYVRDPNVLPIVSSALRHQVGVGVSTLVSLTATPRRVCALRHQVGVGVSTSTPLGKPSRPRCALRHQVGVGVSTPPRARSLRLVRWCAPASSRSGSLNLAHVLLPDGTTVCAPASSRSGSLN